MNSSIIPGQPATVGALANATGGLNAGNLVEPDIDQQLFSFNSDDTPLMNLMLRAKRVKVNSPEVDHFMIDEPKSTLTTTADTKSGQTQVVVPVNPGEENLPRQYTTLLVKGVDGYDREGKAVTPGKSLMLFVIGHDATTGYPIVRAVNGRKSSPEDEISLVPVIPAGSKLVLLANSLYETQKEVDPDLIVPQPTRIYLQKRGMNQVVSDYFESQRKRTPFSKAIVAEQAIANFKVRGNRTLWAGRGGKFQINVPNLGMQTVYSTEGLRWQFKRELQHTGKWSVEKIIALAKMFFTGEDVPKTALLLAGKDLLEQIQCVDFSRHPEISISTKTNSLGWTVTNFHTVFGDIEIKREPTLDRLGWSHSGALIGEDRLVHYVYSAEASFQDRMAGHEATRSGILIWDALALKGSCHIWIDGEGEIGTEGNECLVLWDSPAAPAVTDGKIYYLVGDCAGISAAAKAGSLWHYEGSAWKEYSGELRVD
ncbi:MAG: hypothetical protein K2N35_04455 [Muribaculaceae bacterium]|nr:hypothetical protein [Muribaculaceae bacterium]